MALIDSFSEVAQIAFDANEHQRPKPKTLPPLDLDRIKINQHVLDELTRRGRAMRLNGQASEEGA